MTGVATSADIVSFGALWPEPRPVSRPAPTAVSQGEWTAYRFGEATEQFLNPPERMKRLGRGQSMAIGAVQRALAGAAEPPEKGRGTAVTLGTSLAEEGDEIAFLQKMIEVGEKGAKPAFFVNSVKNALASQVALNFGFQGENQTFSHDALSFESALWLGARLLCAGRARRSVVVGIDGLVEFHEIHGHLRQMYRTDPRPLEPLAGFPEIPAAAQQAPRGSLPGEGAAAFVLAPVGSAARPLARLVGVKSCGPVTRAPAPVVADEVAYVKDALASLGVDPGSVGLMLTGANGDAALDPVYAAVLRELRALSPRSAVGVYRHATGEFATASCLGLALAVRAVAEKAVPAEVRLVAPGSAAPGSPVLLYHLSTAGYRSVMVVADPGRPAQA